MRLLFAFLAVTIFVFANCQADKSTKINFDGFYLMVEEIDKDNDTTWCYLRFYPAGEVISVTSMGTAFEIKEWFNPHSKQVSTGNYEIDGDRILFSTTNRDGTVIYKGKIIDGDHLSLEIRSLINGYLAQEKYYFVKIPNLK